MRFSSFKTVQLEQSVLEAQCKTSCTCPTTFPFNRNFDQYSSTTYTTAASWPTGNVITSYTLHLSFLLFME
ncbi:hypothetical protein E2C01_037140 [Portunus trituberculatus]|uniref:Uncharacterized protein n=1 Tax=Portunus trituberculatus TaxID=210409 RepID=A0A5B7F8J9_PORTR|nr:hypothetical protein [Portunus trituberculatus]